MAVSGLSGLFTGMSGCQCPISYYRLISLTSSTMALTAFSTTGCSSLTSSLAINSAKTAAFRRLSLHPP